MKSRINKKFLLAMGFLALILSFFCIRNIKINGKQYVYDISKFEYDGSAYKSPETILRNGNYSFQIRYSANVDVPYSIQAGSDQYEEGILPTGEQKSIDVPLVLESDTNSLYLKLRPETDNSLILTQIQIISDHYIVTDDIYFLFLIWLVFLCMIPISLWWGKALAEERKAFLLLLFGLFIVNIINYEPFIRFGTDVRVHLLRIEGLKDGLKQGQFPVILYPNSFNGFGEIGALYPKLFLYPAAVLRMAGVSLLTSYKTLLYLINAATLFITCFSMKSMKWESVSAAVFSVLYTLFPYRMYVMGYSSSALGRGISMIFLPVVFAGLYHIAHKEYKKWWMLALGMTGILQSHLLNFIIILLFCIIVVLVFLKEYAKKESLIAILKASCMTILLSAGFLAQLTGYYFAGLNLDYLQFNIYDKLFTPLQFITSPWNLVGIFYLICSRGTVPHCDTQSGTVPDKTDKTEIFLYVVCFVLFVGATTIFPWYLFLQNSICNKVLSTFQNMKRFYFLLNYILPVLFVSGIYIRNKNKSNARKIIKNWYLAGIIIACLGVILPYKEYFACDVLMDRVTGFTEHEQMEYLPEGTVAEDYQSNTASVSDESKVVVSAYHKQGAYAEFTYTCSTDGVYAQLPMFYYKGSTATQDDGSIVPVSKGEKNQIRVMLSKTEEPRTISVFFHVSYIYTLMAIVSLFSGIAWIIFVVWKWRKS